MDVLEPVVPSWDRRVRVFVSSTLEELAPERAAVRAAIERLRLTPVMFELGARAHPPRELYVSYLRQSDIFVGLYGESYGWVAPDSSVSGLEDEYLLSADHPRLLYVKTPAPGRERRLTEMIERIWETSGVSTAPFRDPDELGQRVADDLAVLLTERFRAPAEAQLAIDPAPLPHPTGPLVGRAAERDRLVRMVTSDDARLVTLLGPGGIGKTRLALAVAEASRPDLEAVCFVDLSGVGDVTGVLPALAAALRVQPSPRPWRDVLVDLLAGHRVLIVLDNVEHLLGAAREVGELLSACPSLRVLATSRSVLRLHGEQQVQLEPLPADAATELFEQRARLVRPDFTVDARNRAEVASVLRRLEGIPLAIELAAARMRLLPVAGLLPPPGEELDLGTRDVDVPDRQRTLRATIAWSYGLLSEEDQRLARCLAVLRSTWTVAAAEAVAGPDVLDGVGRLVEHSLLGVQVDGGGEPRLRMLRTVQAFLDEELRGSGDRDGAVDRLKAYVVRLATEAGVGMRSGESRVWRARVDAEIDAVRAVLDQAVAADDAELAVTVAAPLTWYWWSRGLLVEMLQRAERVASLPSAADLPSDLAGVLLWCRGTIRIATGELEAARPLVEQLIADAEARGDDRLLPLARFSAALVLPTEAGDEAEALLVDSARLFEQQGEHWGHALALAPLGGLQLLRGRPDEGRASHERALEAAEVIDDDHMRAVVLDQLAADCLVAGDDQEAATMLCRAAWTHLEVHDDEGVANCLDAFAALSVLRGEPDWALRCLTAADRVRRIAGVVVWPFLQPLRTQLEAMVLAAAGSTHDSSQDDADGLTTLAAVREHFLVRG